MIRYRNQSRFMKIYLWIKYRPLYFLIGCGYIFLWIITGCLFYKELKEFYKNRWDYCKYILFMQKNLAHAKMGNYVTINEILDELKQGN